MPVPGVKKLKLFATSCPLMCHLPAYTGLVSARAQPLAQIRQFRPQQDAARRAGFARRPAAEPAAARRAAYRIRRIGVLEKRPAPQYPVDIRRGHVFAAVARDGVGMQLIDVDEKNIRLRLSYGEGRRAAPQRCALHAEIRGD